MESILNDYFLGNAPFISGKKKDEFPDAFILNSLLKDIRIISSDTDWITFAKSKGFDLYHSIADFILLKKKPLYKDLIHYIHGDFKNSLLLEKLSEYDLSFFNDPFVIEDTDNTYFKEFVSIDNIEIFSLSNEKIDENLIEAYTMEATLYVTFNFHREGGDINHAMYDNEEGGLGWVPYEFINEDAKVENYPLEVTVEFYWNDEFKIIEAGDFKIEIKNYDVDLNDVINGNSYYDNEIRFSAEDTPEHKRMMNDEEMERFSDSLEHKSKEELIEVIKDLLNPKKTEEGRDEF